MESDSTCTNDLSTTFEDAHCLKQFYNLDAIPNSININDYINQAKYSSCSNVIEMIDKVQKVIDFVEETKDIELNIDNLEKILKHEEKEEEDYNNQSFLSDDYFFNNEKMYQE